jgi:putative oxidoreductase
MGFATTVLRVATGATMAGHGLQKLTTGFGGGGLEAAGENFEKMGLSPGRQYALLTGSAEALGGSLLVLGLGTPFASSLVSAVMTGAIAKVHWKNGFWASKGGIEHPLLVLASTFAIAGAGGGPLAIDGLRGKKRRGFGWAFAQLAAGAGGAAAALAVASRQVGRGAAGTKPTVAAGEKASLEAADGTEGALDLAGDAAPTSSGGEAGAVEARAEPAAG